MPPTDAGSPVHDATQPGTDPSRLKALFGDGAHRGLRRVQADIENDRVMLSGTVASYYLKQMAQERVRQAFPKLKLSNDLVVQPSS